MKIEASNPEEYIRKCPLEHREALALLRETLKDHLPAGFKEEMSYGMIGYVVPHSLYPAGYHCNTALPLPFINIASQKNFIGFYHMGIYADKEIHDWFTEEYKKVVPTKLDMGKSCLRLKKPEYIPYALIAALCERFTVKQWVDLYESTLKK